MPEVIMDKWEIDWYEEVGRSRHNLNNMREDRHYYETSRMEDNERASIAACAAEMAVAKLLNRYWSGHTWDPSQDSSHNSEPDIKSNIEVRRIRDPGHRLTVRTLDVQRSRDMFLAYPYGQSFSKVEIVGWIPSAQAWELGWAPPWDPSGTRLVDQSHLLDPLSYDRV